MDNTYEAVVIGAGPAGLSAAIYLGRAHRKTLLIYQGLGRTALAVHINNYLGLRDISGKELIERGLEQAKSFDVQIINSTVKRVKKENQFQIETPSGVFYSDYLIVATGVNDVLPDIDDLYEFLGKSFFTCSDCDAYNMTNKKAVVIGIDDKGAKEALEIRKLYSNDVTFLLNGKISIKIKNELEKRNIKIIEKVAKAIKGENGQIKSLILEDNSVLECDCVLSRLGYEKNDSFLTLEVKRNEKMQILVSEFYESSVKSLFVIGPLNQHGDQVSVAVGEGSIAARKIISDIQKGL